MVKPERCPSTDLLGELGIAMNPRESREAPARGKYLWALGIKKLDEEIDLSSGDALLIKRKRSCGVASEA